MLARKTFQPLACAIVYKVVHSAGIASAHGAGGTFSYGTVDSLTQGSAGLLAQGSSVAKVYGPSVAKAQGSAGMSALRVVCIAAQGAVCAAACGIFCLAGAFTAQASQVFYATTEAAVSDAAEDIRDDVEDEMSRPTPADEYDEFADLILDVIIEDDMDDYEKCCAVYDYIHAIPYYNYVFSEDWRENGYMMLKMRGGDCFGYYSASRLLLERLGYDVIEVTNNNGFNHVWCLVSTDSGITWRHFDPTCWSWGSTGYLCMITDEELEEYAKIHAVAKNTYSHDWNRELISQETEKFREDNTKKVYFLYSEDDEEYWELAPDTLRW